MIKDVLTLRAVRGAAQVMIGAWIFALCSIGSMADAKVSIDDHLRHARIMLATISPDGNAAAYLLVRADPIADDYNLSVRTVDTNGKSPPANLAEFKLSPTEAFESDSGAFLPGAADLRWVSEDKLLFTDRVNGKARLALWSHGAKSVSTIMSGHDRIELSAEAGTNNIIITTRDFVPPPQLRAGISDQSLRMVDGYRFYKPVPNPKEGRRVRMQRWSLSLVGAPAASAQGEASEEWDSKPEEWAEWPVTSPGGIEESVQEKVYRYGLEKSPKGTMTVATEYAHPTVPGTALTSTGLALEQKGIWKPLVPRDPSVTNISVLGWRSDSKAVFYIAGRPQSTSIAMVSLDGQITTLYSEQAALELPYGSYGRDSQALSRDGKKLLLVRSTNLVPDELVKLDLRDRTVVSLDAPNEAFGRKVEADVRFYPLAAINEQVWGRLYLPRGADRLKPLPLLIIHYISTPGYEAGTGDEIPVLPLVEAGIAVFAMHSRNLTTTSSTGDFRMEMSRVERPLAGMESIIEQLADEGLIDRQRVGLWGMSYGAEIAAYATWKSSLFAAVAAASTSWDSSLIHLGGVNYGKFMDSRGFPHPDAGTGGMETWRNYGLGPNAKPSLPPLLIQSGDGEQALTAPTWKQLQAAGAPVEWLEYPNEGHVKRGPANKYWVFQRNLDWFRFWLQDNKDTDPQKAEQYERWRKLRK